MVFYIIELHQRMEDHPLPSAFSLETKVANQSSRYNSPIYTTPPPELTEHTLASTTLLPKFREWGQVLFSSVPPCNTWEWSFKLTQGIGKENGGV